MSRIFFAGLFALSLLHWARGTYKLCAFPSMDRTGCDLIEEGNSNVSCVRVTDSVECSLKLREGSVDFALYSADEAVLAGKFIDDYVKVIGEARYSSQTNETNAEDFVVLVKKPFSGRFNDLQGKGYCHPGVGLSHTLNDKIMKSFEDLVMSRLFPRNNCNHDFSVAEQELRDLESVFGPSCRPGRWAEDKNLNDALKRRYRNMCRLCESRSACANGMLDKGLQKGALDCLAQRGDVAYVSLNAVKSYFGLNGGPPTASTSDYVYLCPNETVVSMLSSAGPCIWSSQPWPLFVARKSISDEVQTNLLTWLSNSKKGGSERWQSNLKKLLLKNRSTFVTRSTDSNLPIIKYIDQGVATSEFRTCRRQIEWCTTSDVEKEKCQWLQGAAQTFGIQPHLACSNSEGDKWKCLERLGHKESSIVSIPTDDGSIARNTYNLTTVFFEDSLLIANYKILAVLKAESTIASFKDLKFKRACFPEYNGLAWDAFTNTAKQLGLLGKQCPESFFTEACAPGANSVQFSTSGKKAPASLCNLCPPKDKGGSATCSVKFSRLERNLRALQCLDNKGDVAFINMRALYTGSRDGAQLISSVDPTKYKVLCNNGSIINDILKVEENCLLATGVHGEIMGRGVRSTAEDIDEKELLLQLNRWFGRNEDTSNSVISMYDSFEGQKGLLFQDGTIYLVDSDDESYNSINDYKSLLQNSTNTCPGKSSASASTPSIWVVLSYLSVISITHYITLNTNSV